MTCGSIFASSIPSRLLVFLVFLALSCAGIGGALAQSLDQGQALMLAMQRAADDCVSRFSGRPVDGRIYNTAGGVVRYQYLCGRASGGGSHGNTMGEAPYGALCSDRPALSGGWGTIGISGSCQDGCVYGAGPGSQMMTVNGTIYFSRAGARANGSLCDGKPQDGQEVGDDQCSTINNLTQCVTSNGKHCAVASSGKRFCWNPNETGTKVSGNEAATKSPEGVAVNNPPVPPKNNGDWQTTGQGGMSSSQGGNTTNYNVTNHTSNYGSNGSGGGAEGEGSGGGDGEGDGDGPGTVGEGIGDLYTPTDKTISSVFGEFRARVGESPIVDSVSSFFSVNVGGSCPVFTVPASEYWETMSWSAHCEGDFNALLTAAGWVLLALASFLAAYIALT